MPQLSLVHILILLAMILGFGGYFGFVSHRHNKGRDMIKSRDSRLYPPEQETFSPEQKKAHYKKETWQAAQDPMGKAFLFIGGLGALIFVGAIIMGLLVGGF